MKGLKVAIALGVLTAAAIAAWWWLRPRSQSESASRPAVERTPYLPARLAAACIAAVEKPNGTKALLADAGAEVYRSSLETLGFICSAPMAGAERKYDLVFATMQSSAAELKRLAAARLGETGVLVQVVDAFELTGTRFKELADGFPCEQVHLWMPGAFEWLFVGRVTPRRLKLEAMMEVFTRETAFELLAEARTTALSDLFAAYVGTRDDWGDALRSRELDRPVQPAFFVTREIPSLAWIDLGGVDEDIAGQTLAEIRSMQVVRRLVMEGELASEAGRAEEATEAWSRARKRNPKDLFLLERCACLRRNASALERIGNHAAAAKCYETLILINPADADAVLGYGLCLKRLGRASAANEVLSRAKELQFRQVKAKQVQRNSEEGK